MASFQSVSIRTLTTVTARLALSGSLALAALLTGCASSTPMSRAELAQTGCDTNAGFAMSGVVHAATKREFDECRTLAQRPAPVTVAQGLSQP